MMHRMPRQHFFFCVLPATIHPEIVLPHIKLFVRIRSRPRTTHLFFEGLGNKPNRSRPLDNTAFFETLHAEGVVAEPLFDAQDAKETVFL